MGRRALNAVGVAAALLQAPADSFLGPTSTRAPGRNGSTLVRLGGVGWGRTCVLRGGHGQARGGGKADQRRRRDVKMNSSSAADAGQKEKQEQRQVAAMAPEAQSSRFQVPPLISDLEGEGIAGSQPEQQQQQQPPPPPPPVDDIRERERSGFSLFRCDAYHCEREMIESGEISSNSPTTTQVMLRWNERPRRALVLLKPEQTLLPLAAQTIDYLQREMGLHVMVEAAAANLLRTALEEFREGVDTEPPPLEVFNPPERSVEALMGPKGGAGPSPPVHGGDGDCVDFVLTLGGDGLLMYSNTLFRRSVPPHLCFNLGSMGFLTPFEYNMMKEEIRRIMTGGMKVSLRMRLSARIIRDDHTSEAFHALNEVVVDRGSSPYLTNLECYCDEQHLTTVQADGLIIATPTGSTAYSMSAGGSMVHPCVPAILFTPICPHSLSFRPIVFPDTVVLRLRMPDEARAEARVSFDGKLSQPLRRGDTLVIKTSNFPVPTICKNDSTADWFASLDQALGFNTRMVQRAFQSPSMEKIRRARNDDRYDE